MTSLELTCEVLKPACARRRTAFAVCFGPPRVRSNVRWTLPSPPDSHEFHRSWPRGPRSRQKQRKMPEFCLRLRSPIRKKAPRPRRGASYYPSFHAGSHLDQRIDILSLQRIQNVALVPRQHVFAGGCFKLSAAFCTWCRQVVSFKQVNDVLCCRNRIFANDCTRMNDE